MQDVAATEDPSQLLYENPQNPRRFHILRQVSWLIPHPQKRLPIRQSDRALCADSDIMLFRQ